MIKVFHVISHFNLGGAENVALNIAGSKTNSIEYHIFEVLRARGKYSKAFINRLINSGIHYHRAIGIIPDVRFHFVFERLGILCALPRMLYLFLQYRPEIIHSHTETADIFIYLFFRLFPRLTSKCHIVRTVHNTKLWNGLPRLGGLVEKFMQSRSINVAISIAVKESYETNYGTTNIIIFNGAEKPSVNRSFNYIEKSYINILFAGRFEEQKGINVLTKIIKTIPTKYKYFFHIIGSGPLEAYVRKELACCNNVKIYPPLYNIPTYFNSFDYLLMPSVFEGLSMLSIEASMVGLPVIINRCPGLKETLPNGWPLAVNNNDINEYLHLFENVIPYIDRNKISEKAYNFVKHNYSIESMRRAYEEIYNQRTNIN